MFIKIVMTFFAMSLWMAFSYAQSKSGYRVQKAAVQVVGPEGEVMLYYRDKDSIVVRNCGNDYPTVMGADGKPSAKFTKRSDCKTVGEENRVPVKAFKNALLADLLLTDPANLSPVTQADIDNSQNQNAANLEGLEELEKKTNAQLANIEAYINDPDLGPTTSRTEKRAEIKALLDDIASEKTLATAKSAAIKKINDLVNQIVDTDITDTSIKRVTSGKHGNAAIYTLLKQFDASRVECGTDEILDGEKSQPQDPRSDAVRSVSKMKSKVQRTIASAYTIEKRIANCAPLNQSKTVKCEANKGGCLWSLVARKRDAITGKIKEVWKDATSGMILGDALNERYAQREAKTVCGSEDGKASVAGIKEKTFGLPSKEDFEKLEKNGIRQALASMNEGWFWSSTDYSNYSQSAFGFNSFDGSTDTANWNYQSLVLCMAR